MPRHWAWLLVLPLCACAPRAAAPAKPLIAVSIAPLKAIVQPLMPEADIHVLTPRGASPHTHEPRPSDAAKAAEALAVLYVADGLDGWVAKLDARRRVPVFDMVPPEMRRAYPAEDTHGHGDGMQDPHFWSDPQVVKATLPALAEQLAELMPQDRAGIEARARDVAAKLDALDAEVAELLAPAKGGKVAVFHHAIDYLLARYGIEIVGAVEPSPGQSAGPRTLHQLAEKLKAEGARAIFVEPQLPPQAAQTVAEAAGIPLVEVDPEGGIPGRESYEELLRFNAQAIAKAFE